MEIDLSNKCRICLGDDDQMHYLFSEFDQGLTLKDILTNTTSFEVEKDDGFPSNVCQNCTTVLVDFYNLKTVYEENLNQIKTLLNGNSETKNESKSDESTQQDEDNEDDEDADDDYITIKIETSSVKDESDPDDPSNPKSDTTLEYEYQQITTYTCSECKEQFLHKDDIHAHMVTTHHTLLPDYDALAQPTPLLKLKPQPPIKCKICNQQFTSSQSHKDHLQTHKKNVCLVCGVGFVKKSYLKDHQEIHCAEKRHVCNYCNKAFKRRTVLVKHRRIHTHPRQCICEICGKAFNDRGTLKTHIMLLHVRTRNYTCLICGVKFPLKATLDKHVRRHQNKECQFFCTQCPLGYRDKSSLDRHIFVKHSGQNTKPTCEDCGRKYTTLGNLFKHKRICHLQQTLTEDSKV